MEGLHTEKRSWIEGNHDSGGKQMGRHLFVKKPDGPVLRTGMNGQYGVWVTWAIHNRE